MSLADVKVSLANKEPSMQGTPRRSRERGIALLAVVAVLVLLAIIATPFLVTMRDGAQRGKVFLASTEAVVEAENVIHNAVIHLGATDTQVEMFARAQNLKTQPATPEYDTLAEFQVNLLDGAGLDADSGRLWGVSVEDESAKINVNSAPFTVLGYFLGMSSLGDGIDADDRDITLSTDGGLPSEKGVVRIGDEVVAYQKRDGTLLRGCQRGFRSDRPGNGPARKHGKGDLVVNETAFQIAAYPILARRGKFDGVDRTEFAPYSNLYELRRVSDLGVASLSAAQWDRIVDHLTVSSRGVVGQTFGDPQSLREPVKAGQDGHMAHLKIENPLRYGLGTVVRVSDGTHTDYGIVYGIGGGASAGYVDVVPALQHDYEVGTARVESLIRTPININTASEQVLTAVHANLRRHGLAHVSADTAGIIARRLILERNKEREDKLPPGITGLKEYRAILRALAKEGSITPEDEATCEMNALNPLDSSAGRLATGTVPLDVRSGGIFTVTARAAVLDRSGRETGRRDFRRVVDVSPQGTSVYEIGGQADLDEVLRATNSKWFTTFPVNLAFEERGGAMPPSRYTPFFRRDSWPSTDRTDPAASLRLAPSRLTYGGGGSNFPEPSHFDSSRNADGEYMDKGEQTLGTGAGTVAIVGDDGMEAFSASMWFKPYWGGRRTAFVLDSGLEEWEDRVALFYDGERSEMVFRVKDTSSQRVAAEIRYPFDKSTWEDDRWYHLHVSASGSQPDQMTMVIDGVKRGSPTLLTWTTAAVDSSTNVTTLRVEDASSFPAKGSVLLRGPNGVEVMEYDGRSSNGFTVTRRFARMGRSDVVDDTSKTLVREFPVGTTVQLYGYSIPVTSIVPEGAGELVSSLGRFNVLVLNSTDANLAQWPNPSTGGGPGGGGGTPSSIPPVATGWRTDGDTLTLNLSKDVSGWNGKTGVEAAAAFGGEGGRGYALLVCTDDPLPAAPNTTERIGGTEVVAYRIGGGSIVLTRGVQPPPNLTGPRTKYYIDRSGGERPFIPKHTYGDKADKLSALAKQLNVDPDGRLYLDDSVPDLGVISLLVPISVEVGSADANSFLQAGTQRDFTPRTLFAQINTNEGAEWIKYDSVVLNTQVSPNVLLVRDRTADRLAALFRSHQFLVQTVPTTTPPPTPPPPDTPPTDDPPPGGEGDGGGGPPDVPPPPDGDDGESDTDPPGTPDVPPPPSGDGGEDDGPGGDPDVPPPPSGDGGEDDTPGGDPDEPPPPSGDPGEGDGPGGDPDDPGDTPPTPEPPDDGGDDDGGSPPDTGGGDPGSPTPGGDPATGAGGTSTTVVPFNSGNYPHFVARFLDFRSTGNQGGTETISSVTQPTEVPVLIGDLNAFNGKTGQDKTHAAGTQVLPCFLVAFPGMEYDPQGDGLAVEMDLDEIVRQNEVEPPQGASGGSAAGGGPSAGGSGADKGYQAATAAALTFGKTGDSVEPGSSSLVGPYVQPGPGFGDEVTLVRPDPDGARETHVVNWSYRCSDWTARYDYQDPTAGGFRRSWTWVAFKEGTEERWSWNYDRFSGTSAKAQASDLDRYVTGALGDPRTFVRLVKSPSGEMPSRTSETVHIGADWSGDRFAKAVVDEIRFTSRRSISSGTLVNPRTFRVGQRPAAGTPGRNILPGDATIYVHAFEGYGGGTLPAGVRTSGGILRIGDELIGYSDYDASNQAFTGCERGALGSEAREHDYGASVSFVQGIGVSRLEEGISETSARIPLADSRGFPIWGGFVRIGEEILGFTRIDPNSVLEMPEGRRLKSDGKFDPYADSNQGAGLFRARYGTAAQAHEQGALVYHLDHRYPDFARDSADHPQLAFYEVSRNVKGALWKRVSWDQRLRTLNGIRVLVRFEGGPAWDSDKVIRLDTDTLPETDRRAYLYEIKDPRKLNLLDVQSDRIDCRVFFTYEKGAWNTDVTPSSDAWKETPWLKAFRIEYAAPSGVLTTEDLR
jgi:hypothetical protein